MAAPAQNEHVWTVSQLTLAIQEFLRQSWPSFWLEGEISNLTISSAGHAYFTLKDDRAQIRAIVWRSEMARLRFELADGMFVLAQGALDVYAGRGTYQIVARNIVPKGIGPLELAFRQLHERLQREGLFDPARKRAIPKFPCRVAIVTSLQTAALRDFLEVAQRRWRQCDIIVSPASVQGDRAPAELVVALEKAQRIGADVIALIRGGGSMEDLWAFNDETLARAIAASTIPVVSGVGHEIDLTIADLAADIRALTPTEAAERIFPSAEELAERVDQQFLRMTRAMQQMLRRAKERTSLLERGRGLRMPIDRVNEGVRRLDDRERMMLLAIKRRMERWQTAYAAKADALDSVSPLKVLSRGYTLALRPKDQSLVQSADALSVGDAIEIRWRDDSATCRVEEIHNESPEAQTEPLFRTIHEDTEGHG